MKNSPKLFKVLLVPPKSVLLHSKSISTSLPQNDGVPALVTLKKGLVALARQWMKFIVVTQGFKAIGLMRPNQLSKAKEPQQSLGDTTLGLDNGAALQSDTSADGAEFEFDAGGNVHLSFLPIFFFFSILWAILTHPHLLAQMGHSTSHLPVSAAFREELSD